MDLEEQPVKDNVSSETNPEDIVKDNESIIMDLEKNLKEVHKDNK